MSQEIFESLGMAQAAPDVWAKEYTHPDTGSILSVAARLEPDGRIVVLYKRDGRFHRKKTYTRSTRVAVNAVRMSIQRAGYQL